MSVMEQRDVHLLQTVPPYHLQAIVKTRLAAQSSVGKSIEGAPDPASLDLEEAAAYIFEPRACREVLRALDAAEACVLRELVSCGGRANSRDLALYLSSEGSPFAAHAHEKSGSLVAHTASPLTPGRPAGGSSLYPTPHPHGAFELTLHRLLLLGLLFWGKQTSFVGRDYSSGVYDGVLIVPQVIMEIASQEWELDDARPVAAGKNELPGEGMQVLQRALYLYWSLVAGARDGLPLVNSRLLSRIALRQVLERLTSLSRFWPDLTSEQIHTENDVPYLLFLRLLLMRLGLLFERQGTLRAAPAKEFFALSLAERAWRCFHLWLETPFWNELAFLPNVVVQPGPAPLDPAHEEVVHARQLVVKHVLQAEPEAWRALPTFIARMKLHIPYLLFPRQYGLRAERYSTGSNPYGWNFRLRRGWLTHREGWHLVEGGFIRTVVTGPLHWLGVIELASEESSTTFRLSSGAAAIMSSTEPRQEPEAWGRLIVQPNFELIALAPVSELLLVRLDRFAERTSLEHIAQYRLTKASVTRAIQKGLRVDAIQQTLEQAVGGDIPQNVRYSLVEWERQARRVEVWQGATLLEADNAALLDELFASDATRYLLGRRLSPLLAEVVPHQLAAVQQILWQRHYLPALSTAPTQDTAVENGRLASHEPQWRLHDDGLLQPLYAVLDLYLAAEVKHFSDCEENTGWYQLTPASLLRAREEGISLDYILRFLQQYCEGGIPGSLLIRLKLWGGGYGERQQIAIERSPMLRLPAQVLQDLQKDEELKLLLGSEVEHESRLVRVDSENLAQVEKLLNERGFALE